MGLSSLLRSNQTNVLYIEVAGDDVSFNTSAVVAATNASIAAAAAEAVGMEARTMDPLALVLDDEMPSVAWNLLWMAILLLASVLLVGKSLGG